MASLLKWVKDREKNVSNIAKGVFHAGQAVVAEINPADGNRTAKTVLQKGAAYAPNPQASVKQQAQAQYKTVRKTVQNTGKAVAKPVVQLANTAGALGVGLKQLPTLAEASLHGNDQQYAAALKNANINLNRSLQPNAGLMHAGTLFKNPEDASGFHPEKVAAKAIGTGTQLATFALPEAKVGTGIAKVAARVATNAGIGAAGSAAAQYTETGKVKPVQVAKDAAIASGLGEAGHIVQGLRNAPRDIREHTLKIATNDIKPQNVPVSRLTSYEGAPDKARVQFYKDQINSGRPVKPIIALKDSGGKFGIEDGKHRFQAYKELGLRNIPTKVTTPKALQMKLQGGYIGEKPTGNMGERPSIPEQNLPLSQSNVNSVPSEMPRQARTTKAKSNQQQAIPTGVVKTSDQQFSVPKQTQLMNRQGQVDIVRPSLQRQRGFIDTIQQDPSSSPKVKQSISSLYTVRNTKDLQAKAANLVKANPDLAYRVAMNDTSDIGIATGSELMAHLQKTGNTDMAVELAHTLAKNLTTSGQTSQAASIYGKLAPKSILRFAAKEINKHNKLNNQNLKLTPEQALDLSNKAAAIQRMPEGRARDIASAELLRDVHQAVPSNFVDKVSTAQTIAQLLNPKTMIRNVGGNAMFGGLENVSQVLAAGLDKAVGAATHNRTTALPQLGAQYHGAVTGLKQGTEEAWRGINLGPNTQFDLNDIPVFRDRIMGNLERTMGVALRSTDRAAYQAAFDDTVQGLMKANHLTQPTTDILDQANINGLYRTFQDNSKAAQLFSKLKSSLNAVGFEKDGRAWGLGDLILKYPKTPGNIIARGIDYSPLGIIKALKTISDTAFSGQPFDQHTFVNSTSRAVIGTGTIGVAGAVLGSLGIITEKPSQDTDTRNLQKKTGLGGYQINISALKRFLGSGFNKDKAKIQKGDTLVSYDWAQPLAIPLSAGAAIGKGSKPGEGTVSTLDTAAQGVNTLVEQPLVTGVNTFSTNIKNKGIVGALGETAKGAPASFVPTASNQAKQLTDNTTRSTYDPSMAKDALNKVKNRIPGLSKTLQPQVDTLGDNKETYQGGTNNFLNVVLNPAFVNKYDPSGAAKLPLDILDRSGNNQQMPRTLKTTQTVNGKSVALTPQQNTDLQRYVGTETKKAYEQLSKDPKFMALSDEEKASKMSTMLTNITKAGKVKILGDTPSKTQQKAVNAILGGKTPTYNNKTSTTYPKGMNGNDVAILKKHASLSASDQRKALQTQPDYQFKLERAQYEKKKHEGSLTSAQDIQEQDKLAKLKIGASFDPKIRDLYSLSKTDLQKALSKQTDPVAVQDQLNKYDSALVAASAIKEPKYSTGFSVSNTKLSNTAVKEYSDVASRNGIPPAIFAALIKQESGGNQAARSPVGAIGITQLMPDTARGLGVNPFDARDNLEGGARYLKSMYDHFGNWPDAIRAYHGGTDTNNWGPKTQNYVSSILSMVNSVGGKDVASILNTLSLNDPGTHYKVNKKGKIVASKDDTPGTSGRHSSGSSSNDFSGAKLASILNTANAAIRPPKAPAKPNITIKTNKTPAGYKHTALRHFAVAKPRVSTAKK